MEEEVEVEEEAEVEGEGNRERNKEAGKAGRPTKVWGGQASRKRRQPEVNGRRGWTRTFQVTNPSLVPATCDQQAAFITS